jgi:acetyl esterase
MSLLARPAVASLAARALQHAVRMVHRPPLDRFPEFPRTTRELTIPNSVVPARAVVYLPADPDPRPAVHVNFHGGGFVMPLKDLDDPLCRLLAAQAGVAVVNVAYALAPQHRFPDPPHQAYEIVRWIAEHGAEHGWDGGRLTVGGQSAGGALAAAVARQAFEQGGPPIALQALHYPPLDLAREARDKRSVIARPMLRPWMGEIFNGAYVPDPRQRTDRLVSPANPEDTADITGIAPALVVTTEFDLLRAEGERYADRLREAGALVEHVDVSRADHGYDIKDAQRAREIYGLIARHVRRATSPQAPRES